MTDGTRAHRKMQTQRESMGKETMLALCTAGLGNLLLGSYMIIHDSLYWKYCVITGT